MCIYFVWALAFNLNEIKHTDRLMKIKTTRFGVRSMPEFLNILLKRMLRTSVVGWVKMTFSLLTEALESLEMFALLEDLVIHAEMLRYLEKGGNK